MLQHEFEVDEYIEGAKYDPKTKQYTLAIHLYGLYCYEKEVEQYTSFTDKNIKLDEDIVIYFDYDEDLIEKVKEIPGRKWDNTEKRWELKPSLSNIQNVVKFARDNEFNVHKEVYALKDKLEKEVEKSKAIDSNIEIDGLNLKLRPFQKAGVDYAINKKRTFIADQVGLGKDQPLDAKLLTPNGWVTMGEIQVGDYVIGSDGKPTKVIGVYPQGLNDVYEVIFNDGSSTECGKHHLWNVNTSDRNAQNRPYQTKELIEIKDDLFKSDNQSKRFIPLVAPIEMEKKDLPIDPYVLGVLLGDGELSIKSRVKLSNTNQQLINIFKKRLPKGIKLRHEQKGEYSITDMKNHNNRILDSLRELNLQGCKSYQKFIPKIYLQGSIKQRQALLQGLLDTDGYAFKGRNLFYSSSKRMCKQVLQLIQSLGGVGRSKVKNKKPKYTYKGEVRIGRPAYQVSAIKVPKSISLNKLTKNKKRLDDKRFEPSRAMKEVNYIGKKQTQCISVNADDGLYVTDDHIVTHNTVQAIATINQLNAYPALIICPAFLKINWKEEYKKWLEDDKEIVIIDGTKNKKLPKADIYIINYYIIKDNLTLLKKLNFSSLICDESHNLKGYKSQRTKAVKKLVKALDIPVRLLLSATPIKNKPKEYIPQLEILDRLEDLGGFWNFTGRYCDRKKTNFGMDINGASNLEELNQRLREVGFIRRKKSQVLKELPPVNRSRVWIEIDNRSSYEEAERDIFNWLKKNEGLKKALKARGAEVMVKIAKLRKLSAQGKKKNAYKWINEFLETGEKLILFAHHIDITESIAADFNCLKITGNTTDEEKDQAVKQFQNDPNKKLIVISIQAGSEGITLTEAQSVAFLEFGWTPAEHDQAEGRAYGRLNDIHGLNSYYLVGKDTIDESILNIIDNKREIVDKATDGEINEENKEGMLRESLNYLKNKYN